MKKAARWLVTGLTISVLLLLAGPSSIGGPATYVIVDGRSMEPTYRDGDLVITRQQAAYSPGDVIVYDAPIDAQFNVIHRIVEPVTGGFVTQGDNMERPDGWIAPHGTIRGASWIHIPGGGLAIAFLRRPAVLAALTMGLVTLELLKRDERAVREQAASDEEVAA